MSFEMASSDSSISRVEFEIYSYKVKFSGTSWRAPSSISHAWLAELGVISRISTNTPGPVPLNSCPELTDFRPDHDSLSASRRPLME